LLNFAAGHFKATSVTFSHLHFILKNTTCFRASFNVALEWYITFSTDQWCKAFKGGSRYLWKRGVRGNCLVILP